MEEGEKQQTPATATRLEIRDLPNEVLGQIFIQGTDVWKELYPYGLPFPILISGICGHWRLLAQSTPDLWTFIYPPLHSFSTVDGISEWMSNWLNRSGALPFSIMIDDRSGAYVHPPTFPIRKLIVGAVGSIASQTHRLHRLDIWSGTLRSTDFYSIFQPEQLERAHLLDQVSLCLNEVPNAMTISINSVWPPGHRSHWLVDLPRLRKLRLRGTIAPCTPDLTSLELYRLQTSVSSIQSVFESSPSLKCLVLPKLQPLLNATPFSPRIEALSLETLAVSFAESQVGGAIYLLELLVMPKLKSLEVDGSVSISSTFGQSLSSSPHIQWLRISNRQAFVHLARVHTEDNKILQSFGNIRHIEIIQSPTEGLLTHFTDTQCTPTRTHSVRSRRLSVGAGYLRTLRAGETSQAAQQATHWPAATSITLDTLSAQDVMHLCRFVQARKGIVKVVYLPKAAQRHLSGSLWRNGDLIFQTSSFLDRQSQLDNREAGTKDVREWLSGLVEIRSLGPTPPPGLLDGEKYPMRELPN